MFVLLPRPHWRRRVRAGKTAPRSGDTGCHHLPCSTSPPGLRFSATRAAAHRHRQASPGRQADSCTLVAWSALRCCSSEASSTPIHGRLPAACRPPMGRRVSAATIPKARLHSRGPSTSPCSAPRSFGVGGSPSCSTWDRIRCFHAAAAVCFGRNRDAASRTAFHSTIPKRFFSSTLILASRGADERWPRPQRLGYPLRFATSRPSRLQFLPH